VNDRAPLSLRDRDHGPPIDDRLAGDDGVAVEIGVPDAILILIAVDVLADERRPLLKQERATAGPPFRGEDVGSRLEHDRGAIVVRVVDRRIKPVDISARDMDHPWRRGGGERQEKPENDHTEKMSHESPFDLPPSRPMVLTSRR
jgi:hypothetical protein